jgi:hemerythrin superfamily protein
MATRRTTRTQSKPRKSHASRGSGRRPAAKRASTRSSRSGSGSRSSTRSPRAGRPIEWDTDSPEATGLLVHDHEMVKKLLKRLSEAEEGDERMELFRQVETELKVHTKLEEEIFYPAFKEAAEGSEDRRLYYEAWEEHESVDRLLAVIHEAEPESDVFAARCKVLREQVEHHAQEEQDEMFPKARKLLGKERMQELGRRMQQRRQELLPRFEPSVGIGR